MTRRKRVRKISLFLALIFTLSIITSVSVLRANRLEREKEAFVQQAVCELDEYVSSIDTALSKGVYATTPPMILSLSTEVWRLTANAKMSLSLIPEENLDLGQTNRFFSQLGEFMMSLNRKAASGKQLDEKDVAAMREMLRFAKALHAVTSSLRDGVFDGTVSIIPQKGNLPDSSALKAAPISTSLEKAEQTVVDFPSLIYDGPFSDHIDKKNPEFLKDAQTVSVSQAKEKCLFYTGADEEDVFFSTMDEGTIRSYVFECGNTVCAVTEKGGYLCYTLCSDFVGEEKLSLEQAKEKADIYLEKIGYENMRETYYSISDGVCTFNYASKQNNVICYPDLIKVSVSLADGRVMSLDARNYIMSHTDRSFDGIDFSQTKKAQGRISPLLKVIRYRPAVIPTDSGNEKICYEFLCEDEDKTTVLVYIDALTFDEADILLLTFSDNGVLTK